MNIKTSGFKCDRSGWQTVRLGEISDICTGKRNNQDKNANGKYPFFVRSSVVERIDSYSFDGEAILMPGEGNIGDIVHYVNGRFDYHQRVYKISSFPDDVMGRYIYHVLKATFKKWALGQTVKATVDSLRLPTFKNFQITLPSYQEQSKIAHALDSIDNQISATQNLLSKYESIKKATVKKLMTPTAEWQEATLGDFYTVSSGLSKGAEFFGSGYPFLSFVTVFNNPIIPDKLDDLVESSAYERKQCSIRCGDVFLTRTSETLDELGMSSVALKDYPEATFNGFTKRLRPIDDIPLCPEFMAFYLRTENFRKSICQKAAITTRASLNKDTIEKLVIAYPIPSVQHEIAKNLMTLDKQRMILVEELDKLKQLKQSMLQYFFG